MPTDRDKNASDIEKDMLDSLWADSRTGVENDFMEVWSIGFGVPIILVRKVRRADSFEPIADFEEYISWTFLNI